jgi:hypothetical protein
MGRKLEHRCCLGCGRDTHGQYCHRCIGHDDVADKGKGYPAAPAPGMPLEDDYGEESNANSVCEDDSVARV